MRFEAGRTVSPWNREGGFPEAGVVPTYFLAPRGRGLPHLPRRGVTAMYLRHSVRRKDGKTHVYWRLVRSVRRNGKVVQETVAQLGELDAKGRAKAKALARQITGPWKTLPLRRRAPRPCT